VYHKNENVKIESCQFRNGKCYYIKVSSNEFFKSNRNLKIREKEIYLVKELGLSGQELIESFNVLYNIPLIIIGIFFSSFFFIQMLSQSEKKFKAVKLILRKGIKVKYPTMMKLKKFIDYSIADVIDQERVNVMYFQMMKSMRIFNRLCALESWLLRREWNGTCKKKVRHKHILGKGNTKLKEADAIDSFAVSASENVNFEIVRRLLPAKLNKVVSYLR
jgi:hypothetical protein